jgi:hypothetical protein
MRADVQERRVFIAVRGDGRQPRDLLAVIRREFVEIHGCIKGLAAEEKVPAPGYPAVKLDCRKMLVREANQKMKVEFETATECIELPLGKLLDNIEEFASRRERATNIINIHDGGKFTMEPTITTTTTIAGNTITNSVVGPHMENITHVIQQLPPELDSWTLSNKPAVLEMKSISGKKVTACTCERC